jgi:phosphoribosylaminoimidazole (AIR) synthetase
MLVIFLMMYERGNESSQNLFNLGMGLVKIIDENNSKIKE